MPHDRLLKESSLAGWFACNALAGRSLVPGTERSRPGPLHHLQPFKQVLVRVNLGYQYERQSALLQLLHERFMGIQLIATGDCFYLPVLPPKLLNQPLLRIDLTVPFALAVGVVYLFHIAGKHPM
ncbi:MAG: hypothetical protein RMM98_05595 [Acidobacteriota bacterium]|nr:hypothetical protein [Blastocatellia bacterium]MDW8239069.1 hypothetical protein [Acidobacteriota bacterium]